MTKSDAPSACVWRMSVNGVQTGYGANYASRKLGKPYTAENGLSRRTEMIECLARAIAEPCTITTIDTVDPCRHAGGAISERHPLENDDLAEFQKLFDQFLEGTVRRSRYAPRGFFPSDYGINTGE